MKNWINKITATIALVVVAQSVAFAQLGYTTNDRDGSLPQLLFRVNVNTGAATNLGNLVDTRTGANAVSEYEGLASIGSLLIGVSEYDPALPNALDRANCATISPTGRVGIIGPSGQGAGNVLFGTEAGSAYDSGSGFIYTSYGDDTTPGPRGELMRLYTNSPSTCEAVFVGDIRVGSATGAPLQIDGLAIDNSPSPVMYGSDGRFTDALYTIDYANPVADPNNAGNFVVIATQACVLTASNEDTGLAFDFANSRIFILYEGNLPGTPAPRIQQITPGGTCTLGPVRTLSTTIPGDYEGFDIPIQTIR